MTRAESERGGKAENKDPLSRNLREKRKIKTLISGKFEGNSRAMEGEKFDVCKEAAPVSHVRFNAIIDSC